MLALFVVCLFGRPLSLRRAIFLDLISGGGVFGIFFVFSAARLNSFLVLAVPLFLNLRRSGG
jgi:hypothetical protein